MLQSGALIILDAKQDANLTWLSYLGLKNWKIKMKVCKNEEITALQPGWKGLKNCVEK